MQWVDMNLAMLNSVLSRSRADLNQQLLLLRLCHDVYLGEVSLQ